MAMPPKKWFDKESGRRLVLKNAAGGKGRLV
jgi:hypothetical protein